MCYLVVPDFVRQVDSLKLGLSSVPRPLLVQECVGCGPGGAPPPRPWARPFRSSGGSAAPGRSDVLVGPRSPDSARLSDDSCLSLNVKWEASQSAVFGVSLIFRAVPCRVRAEYLVRVSVLHALL